MALDSGSGGKHLRDVASLDVVILGFDHYTGGPHQELLTAGAMCSSPSTGMAMVMVMVMTRLFSPSTVISSTTSWRTFLFSSSLSASSPTPTCSVHAWTLSDNCSRVTSVAARLR